MGPTFLLRSSVKYSEPPTAAMALSSENAMSSAWNCFDLRQPALQWVKTIAPICTGQASLLVPKHRIRLISEDVGSERPDALGHLGYLLCEFGSEVVGELAERDCRATKDPLDVVVDLAEAPATHEGEKVCDEVGIIL
jgi:hypothetical protein